MTHIKYSKIFQYRQVAKDLYKSWVGGYIEPEIDMKATGDYIKWVVKDVITEEYDTMQANGYDNKMLGKLLPTHIRK